MSAPAPRSLHRPLLRPLLRPLGLLLVALLTTLLGTLTLGTGAATAADSGNVTWAVRTASNNFGNARTSYGYSLNPGATVKDALVVVNHGKKPLTLGVYASDGFTTKAGQFDLLTTGKKQTSVGAWVHFTARSVTVKADGTVKVPFTIDVPENATPGDYAGGVVTSLVQGDAEQGINVDRRLGIKMQMRIGGDLSPTMAVEGLGVTYAGTASPFGKGDATLNYTVHNTGNAILSAHQKASIKGIFGMFTVSASAIPDTPQLLPGESWKVRVPLHGVAPAVHLSAEVVLTPVLIDAAGSTSTLKPLDASSGTWAVPWTLLLLVVVVVALVVAVVLQRRRAGAKRRELEEARVNEAVAAALREKESQPS